MVDEPRKVVTITTACAFVGVASRTIYNWMADGKAEWIRTAGGSRRIFVDTLWRDHEPGAREPYIRRASK